MIVSVFQILPKSRKEWLHVDERSTPKSLEKSLFSSQEMPLREIELMKKLAATSALKCTSEDALLFQKYMSLIAWLIPAWLVNNLDCSNGVLEYQ